MPPLLHQRAPAELQTTSACIRILVVDDSVVIRRLLTRMLAEDPAFEVVGFAANGTAALAQENLLQPDVITLDIEMPLLDGFSTVRELRARGSKVVIIMCSALTRRGGKATIEALVLGANDYVTKSGLDSSVAIEELQMDLGRKIRQFFPEHVSRLPSARILHAVPARTKAKASPVSPGPCHAPQRRDALAIGVSTGGPTALMRVLPAFPADFPVPIVIVQHMPPIFTEQLAARLNAESQIEVLEAAEGMELTPGRAIIAAGDWHMRLRRSAGRVLVAIDQGERENSCRPSVDVLFHSVAEMYGGRSIALILTGMGHDGLRGAGELKQRGALVIAQSRESSVVWGMPGAVVNAGLADHVLDLDELAPALMRLDYTP
jgi:two-component system chemotaxis response regulator CheB